MAHIMTLQEHRRGWHFRLDNNWNRNRLRYRHSDGSAGFKFTPFALWVNKWARRDIQIQVDILFLSFWCKYVWLGWKKDSAGNITWNT